MAVGKSVTDAKSRRHRHRSSDIYLFLSSEVAKEASSHLFVLIKKSRSFIGDGLDSMSSTLRGRLLRPEQAEDLNRSLERN